MRKKNREEEESRRGEGRERRGRRTRGEVEKGKNKQVSEVEDKEEVEKKWRKKEVEEEEVGACEGVCVPARGQRCHGPHTARQIETQWAPSGPRSQQRSRRGRTCHLRTKRHSAVSIDEN